MKKQTLIIGAKAQAAVMKNVHAESRAYASQQDQLLNQISTIDMHFGAPEKATGYVHIVWAVMVQAGADVPTETCSKAIADKGACGKYLKRLADFIRNKGDKNESKGKKFNAKTFIPAVIKKCDDNGAFEALEAAVKAHRAEIDAEKAKKAAKKSTRKPRTQKAAPVAASV